MSTHRPSKSSAFAVIAAVLLFASSVQAATLSCQDMPFLLQAFTRQHYSTKQIDMALRQRAAERFIDMMDPSRALLLASDVTALKDRLPRLLDTMPTSGCTPLEEAMRLVISRAEEDEKLVKAMLGTAYKLDETATVITDPDKRAWAKTGEERATRVRELVHFQIVNYLVGGMALDQAKKQLAHRYELAVKRLREKLQRGQMTELYAEAFASALDPHSSYMSADTLADFQIQMHLSLEGIGAVLRPEDGFTIIESLVPGGGAERSQKLRPNDKIIAVAQEREPAVQVIDMELQEVVKMIRGKKGTKVTLTVLREGEPPKSFDVTIVRDKIDVSSQAAKITYETRQAGAKQLKIGIIELPSFYGGDDDGRSSYADMKRLLNEAKASKADGIVLDLSKNGGGLLEDAVRIAGLFLRRGAVVATKDTDGRVTVLTDDDDEVVWAGPLVVLCSTASASASEILAGALRDYGRAVIVGGERTFGKGTVQVLAPLPRELGALKVTTGMFFLPSGISTQQKGVASHVQVPTLFDGYDLGEAKLDYSLPPQAVPPFLSKTVNEEAGAARWEVISPTMAAELGKRSQARIEKEPGFGKIKKRLAELEKNKGVVRLSDLRKRAQNGLEDADSDEFKTLEQVVLKEAVFVLTDLVTIKRSESAGGQTWPPKKPDL